MPVERGPEHQYVVADTWAVAQGPGGDVEISAIYLRNRFTEQLFAVTDETSESMTLQGTRMRGSVAVVEALTIRATPTVALQAAEVILRHLITKDLISEDAVRTYLRTNGVLD